MADEYSAEQYAAEHEPSADYARIHTALSWETLAWEDRLDFVLGSGDPEDWTTPTAYTVLGHFRQVPHIWVRIKARALKLRIYGKDLEAAVDSWLSLHPSPNGVVPPPPPPAKRRGLAKLLTQEPWREPLLLTAQGHPKESLSNIARILRHHPAWQGRLWWDVVRCRAMLGALPVDDVLITQMGEWLGDEEGMHTTRPRLIERCVESVARETPRDLLHEWLLALPPWDGTPRLEHWLSDVAESPRDSYGMAIARVLVVSMVARALDPGCIARYVIILEGEENTGKSQLVRTLAGAEWYFAMTRDFESKEAHMDIQGAWVAELPELDSLSRTLETRLKAFITLREDSWIPKYANHRITSPRRTIFIGTINPEDPYLKGQTGNTRFLPIKTGTMSLDLLVAMREQLFAEALTYYRTHPDNWWVFSAEAEAGAVEQREVRRVVNEYEDLLQTWLLNLYSASLPPRLRDTTTWQEIAEGALKIASPEKWKDKALQMQVAQAMRAIGWHRVQKRAPPHGLPTWVWVSPPGWGQNR